MKTRPPKNGSALIIVLGFLGFLMLSAVAFSISMRIEKTAAATYRHGVFARQLLSSAFAEARKGVDQACSPVDVETQGTEHMEGLTVKKILVDADERPWFLRPPDCFRNDDSAFWDANNNERIPSLADCIPFRFPKQNMGENATNRYARAISSYATLKSDSDKTDQLRAYILNENMMNHIPAYMAKQVREAVVDMNSIAEAWEDDSVASGFYRPSHFLLEDSPTEKERKKRIGGDSTLFSLAYPRWQYVNVKSTGRDQMHAIGRYAWTVVNVSDTLDVNSLGILNRVRGIGTGGRDLAWNASSVIKTTAGFNESEASPNLFKTFRGGFSSIADLLRAACYDSEAGSVFKLNQFHWLRGYDPRLTFDASTRPSAFAPYSYWPTIFENENAQAPDLGKEGAATPVGGGQTTPTAFKSTPAFVPLLCPSLSIGDDPEASSPTRIQLRNTGAAAFQSSPAFAGESGTKGLFVKGSADADVFTELLCDYIDKDSTPAKLAFGSGAFGQFSVPSVERVPMLSAIGFSAQERFIEKMPKPDDFTTGGQGATDKIEIEFPLVQARVELPMRVMYPFLEQAAETFKISIKDKDDIFWSIAVRYRKDGSTGEWSNPAGGTKIGASVTKPIDAFPAAGDLRPRFQWHDAILLTAPAHSVKATFNVPALSEGTSETYNFEIYADLYVRVKITGKGDEPVDRVPSWSDPSGKDFELARVTEVLNENAKSQGARQDYFFTRLEADRSFFRIRQKFTANLIATGAAENVVTFNPADFKQLFFEDVKNETDYRKLVMPNRGSWWNIDPRFNWISPMTGLKKENLEELIGGANIGVNAGNIVAALSSPHWVFYREGSLSNPGTTVPSEIQTRFLTQNPLPVGNPQNAFLFSCANRDRMWLPGEIGFLPLPPYRTDEIYEPGDYSSGAPGQMREAYKRKAIRAMGYCIPTVDDGLEYDETQYRTFTPQEKNQIRLLLDSFIPTYQGLHRGQVHAYPMPPIYPHPKNVGDFLQNDIKSDKDHFDANLRDNAREILKHALLGMPMTIGEAALQTAKDLKAARTAARPGFERDPDVKNSDFSDVKPLPSTPFDSFIRTQLFLDGDPLPKTTDFLAAKDFRLLQKMKDAGSFNQLMANTFYAMARETFGDRQQLFLYLLRAESVAVIPGQPLSSARSLASANAVALVWRDAYRLLPDRVIYFEVIP